MLGSILPLSNIPALTLLFQTFDGSMASDWHIHHLVALSPLLGQTPAQGCLSYSLTWGPQKLSFLEVLQEEEEEITWGPTNLIANDHLDNSGRILPSSG